jgi:hypothetical protein
LVSPALLDGEEGDHQKHENVTEEGC